MCIIGRLRIPVSGRERIASNNAFARVFFGFTITCAVSPFMCCYFQTIAIHVFLAILLMPFIAAAFMAGFLVEQHGTSVNMADISTKFTKMTRCLAITHIIIGVLLVCVGIAFRVLTYEKTGLGYFGVCFGIWHYITGCLGMTGTIGRERTCFRIAFPIVFMGLFIAYAVSGVVLISKMIYSVYYMSYYSGYISKLAVVVIMLILGIAAFVVDMEVYCCLLNPCTCCACYYKTTQQGEQMMDTANQTASFVMTQLPGGPVAVPVQSGDGTFSAQGVQPAMVLVPVSGASGGQPLMVQTASSDAMATGYTQQVQSIPATGNPPQHAEMSATHGHGGYMLLNEQV